MDTPPDPGKFRLVFTGECYPGFEPGAVRDAVVAALKLDDKRAARLFSGRRVVVRRNLDLPTAHRYMARLSALGAVVHAEPPLPSPWRPAERGLPTTARKTRGWRRQGLAAAGVGVATALLLLVPVAGRLGLGEGPAAPAPVPSTPLEPPAPAAVAPAAPSVTAAPATPTQVDADLDLPEDMSPEARRDYLGRYLKAPGHKAFAISASRRHSWHSGAASAAEAREVALNRCVAALRPGDEACRVIDEDGQLQE